MHYFLSYLLFIHVFLSTYLVYLSVVHVQYLPCQLDCSDYSPRMNYYTHHLVPTRCWPLASQQLPKNTYDDVMYIVYIETGEILDSSVLLKRVYSNV